MRQKHVGLKRQFSAGVSLSSLESHVLPGLEQAARFGRSATRARKRVGTRRVGFYAPARPYAFCNSSRRAARPLTLGVGINMPWTAVRARRARSKLYEWPSAGSRRPLNDRLGAASREERAGSDRKSGELQTMPFSQETAARIGAGLLDRRQWNIRKMRHIGLRSVVKTRTLGQSSTLWRRFASALRP